MASPRVGALVLAAAVVGQTGGNTYVLDEAHVGADGGICVCPDGQEYEVGDNNNGCASLACVGGSPGACREGGIRRESAGMKVVCEVADAICYQANVAYVNKDGSLPSYANGGVVTSPQICQRTCKGMVACEHFTWISGTNGCYLLGRGSVQKSTAYATSGPKDCQDIVLYPIRDEVATTDVANRTTLVVPAAAAATELSVASKGESKQTSSAIVGAAEGPRLSNLRWSTIAIGVALLSVLLFLCIACRSRGCKDESADSDSSSR